MTLRIVLWYALLLSTGFESRLVGQDIREDDSPTVTPRRTPDRPTPRPSTESRVASVDYREQALQYRHEADSLKLALAVQHHPAPDTCCSCEEYDHAVHTVSIGLMIWFILVLFYLCWAIHRYVYNYGLSTREWKVLYPEVYETWLDRLRYKMFGSRTFRELRDELINYRLKLRTLSRSSGDDIPVNSDVVDIQPFDEPKGNPYQTDSFGLPPGTIRGILALTSLVMFASIEVLNIYSCSGLEEKFADLITVFQMVIAFYFGSKAVDVLQARTKVKRSGGTAETETPEISKPPEPTAPKPSSPVGSVVVESPAEAAVLPASSSQARFANFVTLARDESAVPAAAVSSGQLNTNVPLAKRVLALTASFETGRGFPDCFGGISGNFDKQGLSFGALQWNIGQGSLQPMWKEMREKHDGELRNILGNLFEEFSRMLDSPKDDQMRWALGIQRLASGRSNAWIINDDWKKALRTLGTSPPMMEIQVGRANAMYQVGIGYCKDYGLTTERGVALMFDIRVQNGSVDRAGAGEKIRSDFELINPSLSDMDKQVERMRIIARRRSDVSSQQWRSDVLTRKMTIADGSGTVHARAYNLEKEFAIRLTAISGSVTPGAVIA